MFSILNKRSFVLIVFFLFTSALVAQSPEKKQDGIRWMTFADAVAKSQQQRKKVFELSREQEMSHQEIAKNLGLSKHTVNNHKENSRETIITFSAKFFLM